MPALGGIADDYTGATDLATTLVASGLRVQLFFEVPESVDIVGPDQADAIVVGLKSRSAPVTVAVDQSLAALEFLIEAGCTRFYDKYCATFDSTPEGNIGPVLDAMMARLDTDRTIVCQAFPEAGRTVYQGYLFVADALLEETSMRHHPLTPMTDSKIRRLLAPQTANAIAPLNHDVIAAGVSATQRAVSARVGSSPTIFVADATQRTDLDVLAQATRDWPLVSGGAGLVASMRPMDAELHQTPSIPTIDHGHRAILAGSASLETQAQVRMAMADIPHLKLDHARFRHDFDAAVTDVTSWAAQAWHRDQQQPVMIYSVASPEDIDLTGDSGDERTSSLTEQAFGAIAADLAIRGLTQLIVAGGETSGNVVKALGVESLAVGPPLSPGIAWTLAHRRDGPMNLLLKSGSLGSTDLFHTAWDTLNEPTLWT